MGIINKIYGVLTDGMGTVRKTTASRKNTNDRGRKIANALFCGVDAGAVEALTEVYIRLLQTTKELQLKLNKVDPINTYKLANISTEFCASFSMDTICSALRECNIADMEYSGTVWDLIIAALSELLDNID